MWSIITTTTTTTNNNTVLITMSNQPLRKMLKMLL
jgi:hypothetical protein